MAPTKVCKPRPSDQSEPLGPENLAPNIRPTNKSSTIIVNTPGDHTSTPVNTQIAPKNQSKSLIDNFLLKISNLVQKNNLTIIPHFKFSGSVGNLLPTYVASTADPVKMFTQDKRLAVFTTTKSLSSKSASGVQLKTEGTELTLNSQTLNQRPATTCVTQLDGLTNFSNLPPASGVQLKTGGTELTLHSQTLDQRPAPTCVTQLDGLTNFSNLPTALQLKTVKSSTGGNKGPEGTDLHQLMNHHALINDPMFCPHPEVHSTSGHQANLEARHSNFLLPDSTNLETNTSNFLLPDSATLEAPYSTKLMLETGSVFSNSNSNKQTGKSGSVLSHPNSNKQTLQSRRVEFQPDQKQREYRTTYNSFQLQVLEKVFSKNHYPDFLTRHKLAMKIGKSEIKICYWFQNRRAKMRKQDQDALLGRFLRQQLQGPTYPHYTSKVPYFHHLPASRMTTSSSSKPASTSEPSSSSAAPPFLPASTQSLQL